MLFLEKVKQKIFSKKIKSSSDIEAELSLKTIAEIPLIENKNIVNLIAYENKKSAALKAFKNLRTNIQFLCVNNTEYKKVILVTGATGEEGKSFVAANLAVSFAEIGKKVLIIDGNIKDGKQDKIFNIPNNLGLSNYLSNLDSNGVEINEFLSKFINETAVRNVNIITSGTVPPNSAELLALPKLEELIKDAKVFFDIIIIDSGKVLEETEALILTRIANSVILVANYKNTNVEDLNNTKKDIQNVGGKILGVVLNKVKLKKEKKTKEQRKEEFNKFKLKVKEKINDTIENIKRKIQEANQKLLEEAKEQEIKVVESSVIEEGKSTEIIEPEETKEVEVLNSEENQVKEDKNIKMVFIEMFKNLKPSNKENIEEVQDAIEELKESVSEVTEEVKEVVEDVKEKKARKRKIKKDEETVEEPKSEAVNAEEIEEKVSMFSSIKTSVIEKTKNIKTAGSEKISSLKTLVAEKAKTLKENTIDLYVKSKEYCTQKYNDLIDINKNSENEENNLEEASKENSKQEKNETEKIETRKEILDDSVKNEKMILVIVDAENGYCRVFSKEYFAEKLIRGVDSADGYSKAHYSSKLLKKRKAELMDRYEITEKQAERIDPLVYATLNEYDEYLWIERKLPSDKAENYVLCMSKDYEKDSEETEKEYNVRCQRLRKAELEENELNIEYKLENIWKTNKINLFDKIKLNQFASFYEIDSTMKNDSEIIKSNKTKKFYADIIEGAEKRLENANEEDRKKEETEKQAIEEDRKIKQEELKLEQQQIEIEKRAAQERIKLEQENVKAEKKAEQEKLKEEKRKEREIEKIERKEENLRKKKEKQKQKEEAKFQKERERLKQIEEAKLEEDLLEDNLYPKTKHNKNL